MIGVYKITINEKIYIGSSTNITKRYITHISKLLSQKHESNTMQKNFNKNMKIDFEVIKILETKKDLKIWEQCYINYYNALEIGMNSCKASKEKILTDEQLSSILYSNKGYAIKLAKKGCPHFKINDKYYFIKERLQSAIMEDILYGR